MTYQLDPVQLVLLYRCSFKNSHWKGQPDPKQPELQCRASYNRIFFGNMLLPKVKYVNSGISKVEHNLF